jgi:hypothetical protein
VAAFAISSNGRMPKFIHHGHSNSSLDHRTGEGDIRTTPTYEIENGKSWATNKALLVTSFLDNHSRRLSYSQRKK